MEALKKKILSEGQVIGTEIVKVDSFLNHQLDIKFMEEIGREFAARFAGEKVTKILTVEASGIAVAAAVSAQMGYPPVLFAKKTAPNTMTEEFYGAEARSFTKGTVSMLRVAKKYIDEKDRVLIVDDFLAHGEAGTALAEIVKQSGAELVGLGAVIEKKFQNGAAKLREHGIRVESLAVIEKIKDGNVIFVARKEKPC